ncbi:cytolysin-activating lysine-acyltransferase [uncultured Gammaproteobacteria bacterium]
MAEDNNHLKEFVDTAAGGDGAAGPRTETPQIDPETARKIATLRAQVQETFGKVVMAMMMVPRYRHQTLADLQHLVMEPLLRDRIAIAYHASADAKDGERGPPTDIAGLAIWASVSEEVDADIRQQIREGVFPLRLKPDAWASGSINWLIDVIAPDRKLTAAVIANLKQVVKSGDLRLHPLITRLVDAETLQKMGVQKGAAQNAPGPDTPAPVMPSASVH